MTPFISASFSAFLLLLLPHNLQANDATSSLRGPQHHRSLQTSTSFVLPFGIQWILTVSEQAAAQIGFDARAPTPEEYEEIQQATEDWFAAEIPLIYAANNDFTYDGITCSIFDTTYNAASNPWYHSILMNCEVTFGASSSQKSLPTNTQFLLDMNADFMLDQFQEHHLLATNGFFQWSSQVGYLTTNTGDFRPATNEEVISEEIGTVPTQETLLNNNVTMFTTNTTNTTTVVINATTAL